MMGDKLFQKVRISAVTKVVWGVTLVGSGLDFIPKLIQMGFYGGVIVDVNAWDFAFNAVVGVDQPESGPVVGVALDVTASQNWPNDRLRSLALFLGLTV